ncbi:MAG: PilW family protein [Burkholderiaceae bacterium]
MERQPLSPLARRSRGLTLVELLIAMTIGLGVLAAIAALYLNARASWRVNDNLARVQDSGRFALGFLSQDLRMAGYAGCRSRQLSENEGTLYNITEAPRVAFKGSVDALRGYDNGTGWTNPTATARVRGDVIQVRHGSGMSIALLNATDRVSRTVTLRHNALGFRAGDVALIGNCENAFLFRITNSPALTGPGNFPTVLAYAAVGPVGNNSATVNIPRYSAESRAEVMRYTDLSYFIGLNPAGRPALYRAAGNAAEELIDNIEDIELRYGIDTSAVPDSTIDRYVAAADVTAWNRVLAVRVSLLVAGPEDGVAPQAQTYALRDTDNDGERNAQTTNDRRLRQVFSTTVAIRNLGV